MTALLLRPATPGDRDALYDICLRTAAAGADASKLHDDLELVGHVWVGPYLALEPEHAVVAVGADDVPVGYVVGALDSGEFERRAEDEWWPALRDRYPLDAGADRTRPPADRKAIELLHTPPRADATFLDRYPSHLHINLLPRAQGHGAGRRLLDRLIAELGAAGSPGVQLGVAAANHGAVGFYEAYGFERLAERRDTIVYGLVPDR